MASERNDPQPPMRGPGTPSDFFGTMPAADPRVGDSGGGAGPMLAAAPRAVDDEPAEPAPDSESAERAGGHTAQEHHDNAHAMLQQAHAMAPDLRSKQLINRIGQHVTHLHQLASGQGEAAGAEWQPNATPAAAMEKGGRY